MARRPAAQLEAMHSATAKGDPAGAFGALFGATSWSTRTQLTVIGGSLEVTGFALVALDFWWLAAQRAVGWLARWDISTRLRDLSSNVASWLTGKTTHAAVSEIPLEGMGHAGGFEPSEVVADADSFDEVNLRLRDITERLASLASQNVSEYQALRDAIAEQDRGVRADVQDWITRSKDAYLPLRAIGLGLALAGAVVLATANLVS